MRPAVSTPVLTLLFALAATPSQAQQLDEKQMHGRQVFAQSCGICHLQPVLGVKTYGPPLNKTAAAGSDDAMRAIITNGTERMPAFKHYLKPAEIDAIIAYVRTVPVNTSPNAPKQGEMR
ncbi:MAG TPA: c-type cytochrome [Burkholderiales bacterium]|jgi:mono/diheme cytochrome c family protein|nr:c-type cytochrome [Burkholderiales bacterium]